MKSEYVDMCTCVKTCACVLISMHVKRVSYFKKKKKEQKRKETRWNATGNTEMEIVKPCSAVGLERLLDQFHPLVTNLMEIPWHKISIETLKDEDTPSMQWNNT